MGRLAVVWDRVVGVLLPAHCIGCGRGGTYLCGKCLGEAKRLPPPRVAPGFHGFDTATAPFAFEGVARTAVHKLKYSGLRAIAPTMAAPIAEELTLRRIGVDVVVPVPLHPRRLRERGHNQAGLLAKGVAEALGLALRPHVLARTAYEQPQVRAAAREARMANVEGAFAVRDTETVRGQSVLLVDDVMTTGSTLDSAGRALKAVGARRVHAITFAREP